MLDFRIMKSSHKILNFKFQEHTVWIRVPPAQTVTVLKGFGPTTL